MENTPAPIDLIPKLVTAEALAERFDCHTMHIYRLAWKNEIPSVKLGGSRRFDPEAINAFIRAGGTLRPAPRKPRKARVRSRKVACGSR